MSTLRTAFFVKNVPNWERAVRVIAAAAAIMLGQALIPSPWSGLVALGGVIFAVTGIIGFCPACAMVGRRLAKS